MNITGVTHLLWDLDGTLIDSFAVYADILTEAADMRGIAMPDEQTLLHNFHGSLDESIRDAFELVEGADFAMLLNDFLRIQEKYYSQPESHLFTDALNLVKQAHAAGLQQTIITNREHAGRGSASPRAIVAGSSLQAFITDIICGDDSEYRKPDKQVLSGITDHRILDPATVMVIGDQIVDAELAQDIGCRAIIVNRSAAKVPHIERLGKNLDFLTVVTSLEAVKIG